MRFNRQRMFTSLALASVGIWSNLAAAQVTASLTSTPSNYLGNCPGVVTFNGTITSDKPQSVTYVFTRSDGAIDTKPKTLTFKSKGETQKVSDTWTLGGDGLPYYTGWESIKITSPAVVTSSQAKFELRCNPPPNSVLAAHGNVDWHIDTANEFLFGKNMAGTTTAGNHAPDTWSKTHIHTGLTNTSKYYYDKSVVATGVDTNIPNGIDRAMLFFYAGHGNPTGWATLGDSASQGNMRLANLTGGGNLRYYWQCSCEVFAHGPQTCSPATTFEYACPDKFNGAADSAAMRNVFQRWGPALSTDLRMACGGSTEMYCHTQEVDRVWKDYSKPGTTVAQMFLDGFGENGAYGVVPLCMTRGGDDITKTPLYDTTFTNAPNTSGNTHFYLMYPSGTQKNNVSMMTPAQVPKTLPVFKASEGARPALVMSLQPGASMDVASSLVAGGHGKLERVAQTGALHIDSGKFALPSKVALADAVYVQRAAGFLREQGWHEAQTAEPVVTRFQTASMPVNGKPSDFRQSQTGVTVHFKRVVPVDGTQLEVLGRAGVLRVHMNNDGAVLNASKSWRSLEAMGSAVQVKRFEQAESEAMKQLVNSASYRLDNWKLGYKEVTGADGKDELHPVFQFAFIATTRGDMEHPPQLIEIPAQMN